MMYPNTNFLKYFPDTELPEIKDTACRSGCLRIGAFLVLRRIIAEYHLDEIIGRLIGRDSGLFLDLIAYSIIAVIIPRLRPTLVAVQPTLAVL